MEIVVHSTLKGGKLLEAGYTSDQACLAGLALVDGYSTSTDALLDDFYIPCLSNSQTYARSAGFFSGAILALAPLAFVQFIQRRGTMRLICSPRLDSDDYEALANGAAATVVGRDKAVADLRELLGSSLTRSVLTKALSSLVAAKALEVKIAIPLSERGLFHDKMGIFGDRCGHHVSFVGSANESAAAWSGLENHEQLEVFSSSASDESARRSRRHLLTFEETWRKTRRGLRILDVHESRDLICAVIVPESVDEALSAIRKLRRPQRDIAHGAVPRPLLQHQSDVLESWRGQGHRGLVAFATGAGKTLTGIAAARYWCSTGRPALILVPSDLLHEQWATEIRHELPEVQMLTAGASSDPSKWLDALSIFTEPDPTLGPRVVLSTYQTARTQRFLQRVRSGGQLLVIADEVHTAGAPNTRALLAQLEAGACLGLSATPDRHNDPIGTAAIHNFFGEVLQPAFTLADAIRAKRLVPYVYDFQEIQLIEEEQDEWDELSRRIGIAFARERDGKSEPPEYLKALLRRRARILKRASAKAPLAYQLLRERYSATDRWLVYCESADHLRSVREAIAPLRLPLLEYHQAMPGDRKATLEFFTKRGGVLLAIKCLDEGIDIPATDHALILASTTNPREYIQRRGRVLRAAPGKHHATVIDVIVEDRDGNPLSISELNRAIQFVSSADNSSVRIELRRLLQRAGQDSWRRLTDRDELEEEEE